MGNRDGPGRRLKVVSARHGWRVAAKCYVHDGQSLRIAPDLNADQGRWDLACDVRIREPCLQ
jgi:hypothetical protein